MSLSAGWGRSVLLCVTVYGLLWLDRGVCKCETTEEEYGLGIRESDGCFGSNGHGNPHDIRRALKSRQIESTDRQPLESNGPSIE